MRRFLVAAALVAIPTISLATPSQADGRSRQRYNDFYYGRYDTAFEPVCVVKTVRTTDAYGNRIIQKVRICH
ncbi:hypothetical protein [Rhizobium sp. PL01]|uniref:hypothetical protein n=1 Tax=Rhizobium sp. PL01 TaxID=3085631 RepID=UPI002982AB7D|nr:hypothetical protein [Rhizobium sp. PL01]MDW5317670.1 hypothetical protein [Rhizobium sp. PL01]